MLDAVRQEIAATSKTIVVKVGTRVLTHADGTLDHERVTAIAEQIVRLMAEKRHVVLVSSGAVGAGIGRLGLPHVVVPGCIDFSVHGRPEAVPDRLKGRPVYTHNPEFTLVRTLPDEMAQLGRVFAERLNEAKGPVRVIVPTEGLSIPSVPGGAFWDPEADARFLAELRPRLRPDIPIATRACHVNSMEFADEVAEEFLALLAGSPVKDTRS